MQMFSARMLPLASLAFAAFASVVACDDDDDPTPTVDAGVDDGSFTSCSSRTNGCPQGICACATAGKEGVSCCSLTSKQPCTAGDCSDVCLVCK